MRMTAHIMVCGLNFPAFGCMRYRLERMTLRATRRLQGVRWERTRRF